MFYYLIRYWYRLAMILFYRRVTYSNRKGLNEKGPLMIALNHPDSFIDAQYFGAHMKYPVHFITRGDVFGKPWVKRILESLKMIPIFRMRDGKDKLTQNQQTFDAVVEVFKNKGIVLIFVEGFCEHQTELQLPLKKGAPRIIAECWKQGIEVRILPIWLRYDSFSDFGKILDVNFGEAFGKEIVDGIPNEAAQVLQINKRTEKDLQDLAAVKGTYKPVSAVIRNILFPFAMLGKLIHLPLYSPIQKFVSRKTTGTPHYDSVMLAFFLFTYPLYLIVISLLLLLIFHSPAAWFVLLVFPLFARIYLIWKK